MLVLFCAIMIVKVHLVVGRVLNVYNNIVNAYFTSILALLHEHTSHTYSIHSTSHRT